MKYLAVAITKYPSVVTKFLDLALSVVFRYGDRAAKRCSGHWSTDLLPIIQVLAAVVGLFSLIILWVASVFLLPGVIVGFASIGSLSYCLPLGIYYVLVGLPLTGWEPNPS